MTVSPDFYDELQKKAKEILDLVPAPPKPKFTVNVIGMGAGLADYLESRGAEVTRYNPAAKGAVRPDGPILEVNWR